MTERADVVIIGSGFAGAAAAYHLTKRGVRDVVVLESESKPGQHASGKNAALTFQLIEDLAEARLAVEGTEIYADPPDDLSPRPLLRRRGSLFIVSAADRATLVKSASDGARLGILTTLLSREESIRRVPLLADSPFDLALENPRDGFVDIAALLDGYLHAAERLGARLRYDEPVRAIAVDGGRVESVTTAKGTIATRNVVNAAGPWAGEIAELAGITRYSFEPRRRHIFRLRAPSVDGDWPFVWHSALDVYFRPQADGVLTSGCDATPHPPRTPEVDAAAEGEIRKKLAIAFPPLAKLPVAEGRACLRTFSADERFVIGREPEVDGFFWVAALGGHGMSTSYGVGRLATSAVLGESSPELERFSPARFS